MDTDIHETGTGPISESVDALAEVLRRSVAMLISRAHMASSGFCFPAQNIDSAEDTLTMKNKNWSWMFAAALAGLVLAGCGGGGGGGNSNEPDDQETTETQSAEVIGFTRSDSDVLAVSVGREPGEPDLVVLRSDTASDAYELHLVYPDDSKAVATTGPDERVDTLLYTEPDGTSHRFEFSDYNDTAGQAVVTYTDPSGASSTDMVPAAGTEEDGDATGDNDVDDPAGDLTGSWTATETVDSDSCDETVGETYTEDLTIDQSGTDLAVTISGERFNGSIDGRSIEWSGNFTEDGGTTSLSLSAAVNEAFSEITGSTDWNWEDASSDLTCNGTSDFTATRIGGTAMAISTFDARDVDLLDETIDETLKTLSDPFETYLPLNLYKQAGEAVENMAEAAGDRFKKVRDTVQEGGSRLRSLGNGLRCLVAGDRCAEAAAEDSDQLVSDLDRINPPDDVVAGFDVSDDGVRPTRADWDPLVESGEINVEFEVTETPCDESVFATMNPECPQYEPSPDDSAGEDNDSDGTGSTGDGTDSTGDGTDTNEDGTSDGAAGSGAPTASSNFVWENPWGTGDDITLPPAQGGGWMESVMNECTWSQNSGYVDCMYPDRNTADEYSVDDRSVRFADFTDDPNLGGVPRDAYFYRRCNVLKESCPAQSELQYMTVEWANDGSLMRVRNTRGDQVFINDLRRWDIEGRPTGLSVYANPYDLRVDGTRNETNTECNYFQDGIQVEVRVRTWVDADRFSSPDSDESTVGESCPIPDGFQGYETDRPDVAAALQ